jgi:RNA polymerase sigma factor (sigma-70 family)
MDEQKILAERFEANRGHLRAVAYRMLGSASEADDAVQEAWLRLARSDAAEIGNLGGWLTTVVARVCLDMLRSRKSKREEPLGPQVPEPAVSSASTEQEAEMAESVGLAVLVVLQTLAPAERIAFVLHDMFAMPFDEIAPIVNRSPAATRQLASRARRRVHGGRRHARTGDPNVPSTIELRRQREVVDAFLAATRVGDFASLLALLDPDVVLRADGVAAPREIRGAEKYARRAAAGGARAAAVGAWHVQPALVNGAVGLVVAPRGHLTMVFSFTIRDGKIVAVDAISDPKQLAELDMAVLDD